MNRKIFIQIALLGIIFILLLTAYIVYFKKIQLTEQENQKLISNENIENRIIDLEYNAVDKQGNSYLIKSDFGTISTEDENELYLDNVKAIITISQNQKILIFSQKAKYNKINLNTLFYESVKMLYDEHKVTSDKIYLDYSNKYIKIQDNVIYQGENNKLAADILEIDLVTKVSKIYMIDDNQKVKIDMYKNGNN